MQGSGPNGRVIAEDVEKFIKEGGGTKAAVKKAKVEQAAPSKKETAARAGGYDEQKVSELRAVKNLFQKLFQYFIFFFVHRKMLVVQPNPSLQSLIIIYLLKLT